MAPVMGDWDADDREVLVGPESQARLRVLSLLDMDSVLTSCSGASCISFLSLDRVDHGLPSATSSLRVSAHFTLHTPASVFMSMRERPPRIFGHIDRVRHGA